jgi:hypothetical protein
MFFGILTKKNVCSNTYLKHFCNKNNYYFILMD